MIEWQKCDYHTYLDTGVELQTSGTTGRPKTIFQDPGKIHEANIVACSVQGIDNNSEILTICSLKHAGGLLAQTLPGVEAGASVEVMPYNPYRWVMEIEKYTHSHLTPRMADAIIRTKTFNNLNLSGITIMCGSDPVPARIINSFTKQGARFIANWGMTEIGPVAINKTFMPGDEAVDFGKYTILGDAFHCEWRIVDKELHVRGDICVYDDWFATGDKVVEHNGTLYYIGRLDDIR